MLTSNGLLALASVVRSKSLKRRRLDFFRFFSFLMYNKKKTVMTWMSENLYRYTCQLATNIQQLQNNCSGVFFFFYHVVSSDGFQSHGPRDQLATSLQTPGNYQSLWKNCQSIPAVTVKSSAKSTQAVTQVQRAVSEPPGDHSSQGKNVYSPTSCQLFAGGCLLWLVEIDCKETCCTKNLVIL